MSVNCNHGRGPLNPPLSSLRVRSWNVNGNYATLSNHLKDLQGDVDIFMIQEPRWKMIRRTASMTEPQAYSGSTRTGTPFPPCAGWVGTSTVVTKGGILLSDGT